MICVACFLHVFSIYFYLASNETIIMPWNYAMDLCHIIIIYYSVDSNVILVQGLYKIIKIFCLHCVFIVDQFKLDLPKLNKYRSVTLDMYLKNANTLQFWEHSDFPDKSIRKCTMIHNTISFSFMLITI